MRRRVRVEEPNTPGFWGKVWKATKVTFGCALAIFIVYLGFQLYHLMVYSETFRIERIDIYGCERCSEDQVLARLPWSEGESLWRIDLQESVERILGEPWVKHVTVRRVLPRRIEIHIKENMPIAALPGGQGLLYFGLDEEGTILPAVPVIAGVPHRSGRQSSPILPIVTGFDARTPEPGEQLSPEQAKPLLEILQLVQDYPQLSNALFEYNVQDAQNVVAYPNSKVKKVNFGSNNLPLRVSRLASVWEVLEKRGLRGESLDLRYEEQGVVFKLRSTTSQVDGSRYSRQSMLRDGGKEA